MRAETVSDLRTGPVPVASSMILKYQRDHVTVQDVLSLPGDDCISDALGFKMCGTEMKSEQNQCRQTESTLAVS